MTAQNLMSPHAGIKATITPGDTMSRAMGQYGKGHSFAAPTPTAMSIGPPGMPGGVGPKSDPGPHIRDGKGGIRKNARSGGIGPGPNGSYGSSRAYGKSGDNS